MNLVADASVLIAELMRVRGRALFEDPRLHVVVAEKQWDETLRGLYKRAELLRERLPAHRVENLLQAAFDLSASRALTVVSSSSYSAWESVARRRLRDPTDWPTLAFSLAIDAPVLTNDPDFFGCGVATWKVESLLAELPYIEEQGGS